jgi:predicted O-methyltransferase YrrM
VKLLVDEDKLNNIKTKAIENFVPILQDDSLKLIEVMLGIIKPKKILEIGTAVGYSAAVFAKYLEIDENNKKDSYIKTIERNDKRFKEANENISNLGLSEHIETIFADATEYLTNLKEDNTYDVIFIDPAFILFSIQIFLICSVTSSPLSILTIYLFSFFKYFINLPLIIYLQYLLRLHHQH